ncbi:hypothetical protein CHS0354_025359 [Potamilus streckersoni]|uniref:Glycosyltransferase 2-like domain-containing protein n=1 Tax=Potamilus streckersoni TaxID=2493646 RepID=A0AAE0SQB8_9BIVA|nr:hypothetical protein CHS0354_025359 [Potamilus streckersoni]
MCQRIGLEKFKFEIVTDIRLDLRTSMFIREIVVPKEYTTSNNSLYKARALHYCLENKINMLSNDDWIVHLDEETILTEESVIGLANFAANNIGGIGQGVITYANDGIVNWITTLADSVRVSIDIGLMKFCFQKLHRPLFGLKGSYIITKLAVEKDIGFDFGPKGSEMWEKSPFTIVDYIKQRKRWFVGRMYTLLSPNIPVKYKLFLIPTDLSWLLLTLNLSNSFVSLLFPMQTPNVVFFVTSMIVGVMIFLFVFGSIKSFSLKRYGFLKKAIICASTILIIPFAACLDGIASLYGFCGRLDDGFYIVKKDKELHVKSNHTDILV